MVRMLYKYVSV